MVQISKDEATRIRNKYSKFNIVTTGKLKGNHNRKKYYIQPYILFSECNDVISELEKYINVFEMISRNDEAEQCYKSLKNQLNNQINRMQQRNRY